MNHNSNSQEQRKPPDDTAAIHLIADRINSLHNDVGDLRVNMIESMKEMTAAITRLAVFDERQLQMNQSYERLNKSLEKHEEQHEKLELRVDELEKQAPMTKQITTWVITGVGAIVGLVGMFAAKALGLM